jgi:hypothetical protein|tara:strand:+ start:254 stop:613 length:360 start_codon:yes stop_codon:yes gene_type:complete
MSNKDFDLNQVFNSVRSTINPEYAIPEEKAKHPVNFRTLRLKKLIGDIKTRQATLTEDITKLDTQLAALLEIIQPYLDEESKVSDEEIKAADEEDKKAEATNEADKSSDKSEEADKKDG